MADLSDPDEVTTYQDWGSEFFETAVSEGRILGAVNTLAGRPVELGPFGVGPGRIAKVTAHGAIGEAIATRLGGQEISYRIVLPVDLTFELDLQVERQTFDAQLLVPLTLTAVALTGVRIEVRAEPPHPREIQVQVQAQGLRASMVQRIANIEGELRRFVARYVRRELEKPHVRAARQIDVAAAIDHAWSTLAPRGAGVTQGDPGVTQG